MLPPARAKPGAAVYVFAARTGRWKGIFAHHSWIVIKERGATSYTRFDKVAWGRPVKINNWAPDARWYGHTPMLVAAIEGPQAEPLVAKIKAAVARYPLSQPGDYSVWPGPNSNSFIAYVLAAIPEAGIALPPTAIGKDWRVDSQIVGWTPSGTGIQLSLGGLFGISIGWVEGLEVNVLGLVDRASTFAVPRSSCRGSAVSAWRAPDPRGPSHHRPQPACCRLLPRKINASANPATNPPTCAI